MQNTQSQILSLIQKLTTIATENEDSFKPVVIRSEITRRGLFFELRVTESADGNVFLFVTSQDLEELLTKAHAELEASCIAWGYRQF